MNIDRIFELIKFFRPKFYNRLTWVVVITGLGVLSKPLILEILNSIFEANWNFSITGEYDEVVGISLVIIGLAYNVVINREYDLKLSKEEGLIEHDKVVFTRLDELISEEFLDFFLDRLTADESATLDAILKVNRFITDLERTRNTFLVKKIEDSKKDFVEDLNKLVDFIDTEFFPSHRLEIIIMRPELNIDRGGVYTIENQNAHIKLRGELKEKVLTVRKSFLKYRRLIKEKLKQ
jgi:hypothetical protein